MSMCICSNNKRRNPHCDAHHGYTPRPTKRASQYTMPRGTKTATLLAFEAAIRALDGKEPIQIPSARPRVAARLRKALKLLLQTRTIWP